MLVSDRAQGLENLLPTTYYTVGSKMYIGVASNTTYQPRVPSHYKKILPTRESAYYVQLI